MSGQRKVLGTNVIPKNYHITIDANLKTFDYTGTEIILAAIKEPTNKIRLNSKSQKITSASIISKGKEYPAKINMDGKEEVLSLTIAARVAGDASILIKFKSNAGENPRGFYRSKYLNGTKAGYIMTTQFEPVDARSAFPCFDEPAMKATFDISFIIDTDKTAISNMPIVKETKISSKRKQVFFDTSPKMSTYLVYFGIGDFEIESKKAGNRTMRVISTPENANKTQIAFEFAKISLDYYDKYFGIKYPLPKMDLIGVPDFSGGASAMENWGAITFRSVELLAKKETVSVQMKRRIMQVVAHEIAHQWFGDLVTMKWWDDLWLNESFATFMEGKTQLFAFPEWKTDQERLITETAHAMGADSLLSTHPINVTVNNPNEIGEIFDAISYYKGCATLVMLENYVGEDLFRSGIQHYIAAHKYSNAVKEDLWNAIGKAGGKATAKLPKVAKAWIDQPGLPMIEVEGIKNGKLSIRQNRFTILPSNSSEIWPIPIRYITSKGEGFYLMEGRSAQIEVGDVEFVKLNYGQSGFYRVKYDQSSLDAIGRAIKSAKISGKDSWGIVSDLSSLSRARKIKVDTVLDFIENYCMDSDYPLNLVISSYFSALMNRFWESNKAIYERAKMRAMPFNKKILELTGWIRDPKEDNTTTMLRSAAIRSLAECGDKAVLSRCKELLQNYLENGTEIEVNIRASVYMANAIYGDKALFDKFMALYKKQNGGEEIMRLSVALGSFRDKRINELALQFVLTKYVRSQDKDYIAAYVSNSPTGRTTILKWLGENWHKLRETYGNDVAGLGRFFEELDTVDDKKQLAQIVAFVADKSNHLDEIKMSVRKTLEQVEINVKFVDYNS